MDNQRGNEVSGRGYSDEEVANIYELGRLYLESGNFKAAESIMRGLTEVAPSFTPSWLGLSYLFAMNKNHDSAIACARQALRSQSDSVEALLFLVAFLFSVGDVNSAGTFLGEAGELIESKVIDNHNILRFYRAQLARYQVR
jgi:Tfp pilus assembly protein PilF